MPRYFFHVRGERLFIEDTEGIELPDTPDIKARLLGVAREVLAEEDWEAELTTDRSFEIVDQDGRTLLIVPFQEL